MSLEVSGDGSPHGRGGRRTMIENTRRYAVSGVTKLMWFTVIALAIAACGDTGSSETTVASEEAAPETTAASVEGDASYTVGVTNLGLSAPFPAAISDGIDNKAPELGIDVVTLDAQQDVAKQANDVQDLLNQQVDGILLIGVDAVASEALVDDIDAAGIPVIAVHQMVGDSTTRELSDVYEGLTAFVTQDEQEAGAKAGEIALDVLPDGGKVAIVEGAAGFAEVFNRSVLFEEVLNESEATFEIVARQPGDWTPEAGEAACQNMLQSTPDMDLFYSQSDDMAVGCANAVEAAGSSAQIISIGGSALAIDALNEGRIQGTVCYRPFDMGQLAVETMAKVLRGESLDSDYITYETPAITAANVDDCDPQW